MVAIAIPLTASATMAAVGPVAVVALVGTGVPAPIAAAAVLGLPAPLAQAVVIGSLRAHAELREWRWMARRTVRSAPRAASRPRPGGLRSCRSRC
jgi:ABC-type enterobactin transport system permease subunit